MSDKEIRDAYKGLWKIEESFKITKSTLEARPVYVWTKEHIEAHFLTCFVSLVILRLLEHKMDRKYSSEKVINSLKQYNCSNLKHDIYYFNYRDEIIKEIEKVFNVNLNNKYNKYNKLSEIKKILDI